MTDGQDEAESTLRVASDTGGAPHATPETAVTEPEVEVEPEPDVVIEPDADQPAADQPEADQPEAGLPDISDVPGVLDGTAAGPATATPPGARPAPDPTVAMPALSPRDLDRGAGGAIDLDDGQVRDAGSPARASVIPDDNWLALPDFPDDATTGTGSPGPGPDATTPPDTDPGATTVAAPPVHPSGDPDASPDDTTVAAPPVHPSADPDATEVIAGPWDRDPLAPPPVDATQQMPSPAIAAAQGTFPGPADQEGRPGQRRRRRLLPLAVVGTLTGLFGAVLAAWAIDESDSETTVMRGTMLASNDIGGLDRAELAPVFDRLDAELADVPVEVTVGEAELTTNAAALGAVIDRDQVIGAALDVRRDGSSLLRPLRWLGSFVTTESIEPAYLVDPTTAAEAVDSVIGPSLAEPVDPDLVLDGEQLTLVPGRDGVAVDPAQLVDALPPALGNDGPYAITLDPLPAEPRYTDAAVQAVADEANAATAEPIEIRVLDQTAEASPDVMRTWVLLDDSGEAPDWMIDERAALSDLKPLFPTLGSEDQRARFNIVDNTPIIIPASETVICCDASSLTAIDETLRLPPPTPPSDDSEDDSEDAELRLAVLQPEIVGADEGVAELESLGIVEEVSSFTTNHPCCAPRVTNIHRFADLVRGAVIRPGERFSLNEHVGQRTLEKGFVADSAIVEGVLEPQVGGGVSQFATTFFNASFFAGLDFIEYQSHSLYISRYPRGREATISWRKPDLVVENTTDYGILVWPTYTDTSITVTFYSTKNIEVEAGEPFRTAQSQCSRWTTPRTRTYRNGTVEEDSVFAVYRPAEGLDCNGNSTRPETTSPQGPTTPVRPSPDDATPPPPSTTAPPATTPEPTDPPLG